MLRVGVDVGGTNTDAVIMQGQRLLAAHKQTTTADVSSGIVAAVSEVLRQADVQPHTIAAVMIGTTQFTNAIVERKALNPTGVLRVSLPAAGDIPPMFDWPEALSHAVGGYYAQLGGGYQFDGRSYETLNENECRRVLKYFRDLQIEALAIAQVFAPVCADMEKRVANLAAMISASWACTMSHEVGRLGLLERENAAILNAALSRLARTVVGGFRSALQALGIVAPLYISQNDGTVMSAERAARFPIHTLASGPTNSLRGAAFLTGQADAIVVDIGGTTTDVGVLHKGFPRESAIGTVIGGVRTNFRMPDIYSIGLGGGSRVGLGAHGVRVGPESVGYRLTEQARVFGGDVLTLSDIAVAAGHFALGEAAHVAALPAADVARVLDRIKLDFRDAVDAVRTSAASIPVVLVGGGSALIPPDWDREFDIVRPQHAGFANAIGAAIGQLSCQLEQTLSLDSMQRDVAMGELRARALRGAAELGVASATIRIVDEEETPLTYLPGRYVRQRVRAVGDIAS